MPGVELSLGEPKGNLLVGGLDGVRSVDDVSDDIDAEISSDGSGGGVRRLGGAEHDSSSLNGIVTLPAHSDDGSG